jgi:hypothetical protein
MKKYLLIQKQMARVFPVLFNIGMMLVLLIGNAVFPNNVRAASTITVNSTADNCVRQHQMVTLEQSQVIKFS